MIKFLLSIAACLVLVSANAYGAIITYGFSTTVLSVDNTAPNFPSSLNSVMVGDPITGTLTYDTTSPTTASFRPNNTTYALADFSFAVNIGGVVFEDPWPNAGYAEVWDNDSPTSVDGLIYSNVGPLNNRQFQVGNINLPSHTFNDESLPADDNLPGMTFALGSMGVADSWIRGGSFNLEVVPIPGAVWLLGSGLAGLLAFRRKFRGAQS